MEYKELEALSAEAYLMPSNFKTKWEELSPDEEYAKQKYEEGLKIGKKWGTIKINDRSVWLACDVNQGILSSSEGIGYHKDTASLLQGFIDSNAEIVVTRFHDNKFSSFVIQENKQKENNDLQLEEISKIKGDNPKLNIVRLQPLKDNPLSGQVSKITNGNIQYGDLTVFGDHSYIYENTVFVTSSYDIRERLIQQDILKLEGVEKGASVIRKHDILDINYMTRENPLEIEYENNIIQVFVQPKSHPSDQQKVMFMEIEKDKPTIKNNSKIKP